MLWFFLNWSIDYQIKNSKTKFGRITFWILTTLFSSVLFNVKKETSDQIIGAPSPTQFEKKNEPKPI
jgi:hypothetical protein